MHLAFAASNRAQVDQFHAAAFAAGGKDNGKPGLRPVYHPDYYGAFVFDPDGHNVEVVCHGQLPDAGRDMPCNLDDEERAALDRGDVIEAIKLMRQRRGLSLKEAKDEVDACLRGQTGDVSPSDVQIPVAAIAALQEGNLVAAVRATREAGGRGLKQSKDAVEGYLAANPQFREQFQAAAYRRSRPWRTVLKLGLLVLAVGLVVRALGR